MNRSIKETDLTKTVALYVSKYGSIMTHDVEGWMEDDGDYVRITKPIEVTFVSLDDEVVLKGTKS